MSNMVQDLIHLTRMEFIIKYWYLWLGCIVVGLIANIIDYRIKVKKLNAKYDKLDDIFKK